MPLYDWKCFDGHTFERSVPMAERDGLQPCPECGALSKRIFAKAPHLMWYPGCTRPDYKK